MMSDNKTKHIAALGAWAALHAYFLAFHFSWSNFAWYSIMLLFLFCTTVLGKKRDETCVVATLGNLLGSTFAVLLGYYVIATILPTFRIPEGQDLAGAFNAVTEQLLHKIDSSRFEIGFGGKNGFVMLISAVVFFFGRKSLKHPILAILFKYFWTGCIFAALIDTNYGSKEIMFLYVICTLLFVACDIINYQRDGSWNKAGKRWHNILNLLLLLVLILQPDALAPFTQEGYIEYYFLTCGFKWYTALYILIVFVAAGWFMFSGCDTSDAQSTTDLFVFWNAVCVLITLFFVTRFYVGYWWIVVLMYGICVTVTITTLHPTKVQNNEKLDGYGFAFLPLVSIAVIITVIAGHYGRLLITWAFLGGAILILDQFLRRNDEDVWWKDARFYTVALLAIGAIAVVDLWRSDRLVSNFLVLLGLLVVSLVFVWIISCDSGLFVKRSQLVQTLTVVLFAILCISLCAKNGAKIKIDMADSGKIGVDVSSKREDRTIEDVEYYWLEDLLLLDEDLEGFPKEEELINKMIPKRDGRLRVVATDNYGAQTEQIYWVHYDRYSETTD